MSLSVQLTEQEVRWCSESPDIIRLLAQYHQVQYESALECVEDPENYTSKSKRAEELEMAAKDIEASL